MNALPSEVRGVESKSDPLAAPIPYPSSVVRYPLLPLLGRRRRTADEGRRISFEMARPRRMQHSARSLLGWILLWYVVGQLLLFVWMDGSWQLNRTRIEGEKWKELHARLAETPDRPLVLMLGSSRVDWAFQAGRLSGRKGPDGRPLLAYNFGVPTTGPLHEALYLHDLLDEGVRPRLVLVEFVATLLNQSQRGLLSEEHFTLPPWLSAHQVRFFQPYVSNKRRLTVEWLESRLAPWYGFRWAVHEHLQGHHSLQRPFDQARRPMDSWGCRLLFDDPGTPVFRALRWAGAFKMYGDSIRNFRLGAGPVQAMRDLLARCRREHIPVALVVMPVAREFRRLFPPEGQAELNNLLAQLRDDYAVEVIDGSDWLDLKDFDDGHHVLRSGADKFTGLMIEEVQKILARTNPPGEQRSTP
jgi:hypothetical protein